MCPAKRNNNSPRPARRARLWVTLSLVLLLTGIVLYIINVSRSSRLNATSKKDLDSSLNVTPHYDNLEIASGQPSGSIRRDYTGFSLSFNPDNGTADWAGWELLRSEVNDNVSRSDNFWQDFGVDNCPSPDDYRRSGYDKGHLCPAADQKWSATAMSDCFVMTNMAPQDHALNAGAWQTLEKKERLWASRDSAIIIVAGPIYTPADGKRIGDSGVRVPSAFYKVFLAPYLKRPRAIGFIYPNMKCPGNMADYSMSVDKVEEITGLDFFPSLPDEIENEVEARASFTEWNR